MGAVRGGYGSEEKLTLDEALVGREGKVKGREGKERGWRSISA